MHKNIWKTTHPAKWLSTEKGQGQFSLHVIAMFEFIYQSFHDFTIKNNNTYLK